MLDFSNASVPLDKNDILSKVSIESIWKFYCPNFKEINKSFLSEFYSDSKPSCRIYKNPTGELVYKDFGTGEWLNCFGYIRAKYGCTYHESLNIIANDFNLSKLEVKKELVESRILTQNDIVTKIPKKVTIVKQNFTFSDIDYWESYGIDSDLLRKYNIVSCKAAFLEVENKCYSFDYSRNNPIFAYIFYREGKEFYKIYRPKADSMRWISGLDNNLDIQGLTQLDERSDILILTKALKDVLVLRTLNINAIALNSETTKLTQELYTKLRERFKRIIVLYDNDEEGIKAAKAINLSYSLQSIIVPVQSHCKDISDYRASNGFDKTKELICQLIKI